MIDGVVYQPLRRIADDRGVVFHMLKASDPVFSRFGEIYFTSLYPDVIKAWHVHTRMDLNYACVSGGVRVVLYDDRKGSPTRGELNEFFLGEADYALLHIPHGIINGMRGEDRQLSLVANCATLPHDPEEMLRYGLSEAPFSYDWQTSAPSPLPTGDC
ncbi:MAG: dTDP-4-dehydrorhamnose 3,5-epimerase [Candidatus Andersenbacteria bacterium CG10_big_fil_rev_8_21_14_0_10_54_11]|uniref:dTDP-4-dehydrorhamnose 3,5-epimerase n=1 Tax=Candidatus Andersenbacteria bacterium CG10_big_fil_rev_8_21_14_0_10_54_11 TaxID=1974485 RepID=A0A2M6WZ26_9BACT|nr:MAG: dTDP-4-dehydrorhamnose 3,5-epimerase [Candidatus Andersenbacteria bacterium CG10_big_fil_rev_8_21_14_0_10_54_11]